MNENKDLIPTKDLRKLAQEKLQNKYTLKQLQAMYFLANPVGLNKKEICETIGINVVTLWRWEAIPGFLDDTYLLAHYFCKKALPRALSALSKQADKGDIRAIELLLKVSGKYADRQELDIRAGRLEKMSDQEVDQIITNYQKTNKVESIDAVVVEEEPETNE